MSQSVAACVKDIIGRNPFISELIGHDLISYSNLARFIRPQIESMCGKSVSEASIIMAARRFSKEIAEEAAAMTGSDGGIEYEISVKTNIYDLNLRRSDETAARLMKLYALVKPSEGDFLNISIGSHEITLAVSENCRKAADAATEGMEVVHTYTDLVALTIVFHGDFLQTPGVTYLAVRKLAWENINIIEIVSTMNVLTFIISREDSTRAYQALEAFLDEEL